MGIQQQEGSLEIAGAKPAGVPPTHLSHCLLLDSPVVARGPAEPEAHTGLDPAWTNSGNPTTLEVGQTPGTKQLPLGASGHLRCYPCGFLFMIFIKNKQHSIRAFDTVWLPWGLNLLTCGKGLLVLPLAFSAGVLKGADESTCRKGGQVTDHVGPGCTSIPFSRARLGHLCTLPSQIPPELQ